MGLSVPALAQSLDSSNQNATNQNIQDMPGMDQQARMPRSMEMESHSLIELLQTHATAGTDAEPYSTPIPMMMTLKGDWMLMLHGEAFLNEIQQSGSHGFDKLFGTNWIMPMAQRNLGRGVLTLRTMLSLEPATVSDRRYPELFQQGETAFGRPIVDGQHPHNFFMEVAALYDYRIGEKTLLSFYAAPMGDPALGPVGYPHRASASEDPIAPLGHHLEDSTHIANDVVTAGITRGDIRLEASGFHGREPGEDRWQIDSGKIDSWSARVTVNPGQNWTFQYSIGQLHSLEALFPAETTRRMTASVMYNRPIRNGNWASMVLWGRNESLSDGNVGNGYLLESSLNFWRTNNVWTRIENVDRTNELLLGENPLPARFTERYFTRVQAYTAGYDRHVGHVPHLSSAVGGQLTWYGVPATITGIYGSHPVSGVVFLTVHLH
jgi:hypothetical protein